jgi:hypothetical protein
LEVGAEGGFKLDLRLKGAVRTEIYQHHYCQQTAVPSPQKRELSKMNAALKLTKDS